MWVAAGAALGRSCHRVGREHEAGHEMADRRAPLMGVFGAFVFAAQMINFTVPGTGSSGHLAGGLLLAILLGPHAGLLTVASVLVVQALFFADGGLLALGANIFNIGVCSCLIGEPLIYRPLAGDQRYRPRVVIAAVAAAVVSLQLGALGVVLQTVASGITELPLGAFLLLMQPIHLAIAVVEGLVTASLVLFLARVHPELLGGAQRRAMPGRRLLVTSVVAALVVGAGLSWFASRSPDGLEWAIAGVTGGEELSRPTGRAHQVLAEVQEHTAVLPDYALPVGTQAAEPGRQPSAGPMVEQWPAVDPETSLAGLTGGLLTVLLVVGVTLALRRSAQP